MLKYETPTKQGKPDEHGWMRSEPTGEMVFRFIPPFTEREQLVLNGIFGVILNAALIGDLEVKKHS